jgi:hypothetical protein
MVPLQAVWRVSDSRPGPISNPAFGKAINFGQTSGFALDTLVVVGTQSMNETSVYTVERDAWSTVSQRDVHFRLTYEREFLPVQNLWRDFLIHSEETG